MPPYKILLQHCAVISHRNGATGYGLTTIASPLYIIVLSIAHSPRRSRRVSPAAGKMSLPPPRTQYFAYAASATHRRPHFAMQSRRNFAATNTNIERIFQYFDIIINKTI